MRTILAAGLSAAFSLGSVYSILAGEDKNAANQEMKPYQGSLEFQRMKKLAGKWIATAGMHGQPAEVDVEYKVTSGGSALVETHFTGTPKEMVSVYHDGDDGKLSMTPYCMLHNRPLLNLAEAEGNIFTFDLSESCALHGSSQPHMGALVLSFLDDGTVEQKWTLFEGGEGGEHIIMKLKRAASQ